MGCAAVCCQAGRGEGGWACNLTAHTSPERGMEGNHHDKRCQRQDQEPAGVVGAAAPEDVFCSARAICTRVLRLTLPSLGTRG